MVYIVEMILALNKNHNPANMMNNNQLWKLGKQNSFGSRFGEPGRRKTVFLCNDIYRFEWVFLTTY